MTYHNCYCQIQVDARSDQLEAFQLWLTSNNPYELIYTDDRRIRRRLERALDEDVMIPSGPHEAPNDAAVAPFAAQLLDTFNQITERNFAFEESGDHPTCVRWEYRNGDLVAIYNYSIVESELTPQEIEDRAYQIHLSLVWFENEGQFLRQRPRDRLDWLASDETPLE